MSMYPQDGSTPDRTPVYGDISSEQETAAGEAPTPASTAPGTSQPGTTYDFDLAASEGVAPGAYSGAGAAQGGTGGGSSSSGAGAAASAAKGEAASVASDAAGAGRQVASTAKDEAKRVGSEAIDQAKGLLGQAGQQARDQAGQQQQRVAEGIRSIGSELSSMAESSQDSGVASQVVRTVAQQADSLAGWLDARDPGSLLSEVKQFAARKPGTFIAIAAVAGIVAGRLTTSLVSEAKQSDDTQGADAASGGAHPAPTPAPVSDLEGSTTLDAQPTAVLPTSSPGVQPTGLGSGYPSQQGGSL